MITLSKIYLDLISYYKNKSEENIPECELENIEITCQNIIKNNIFIFKDIELNLNEKDITINKIDKLYLDIIISLIKTGKILDYE